MLVVVSWMESVCVPVVSWMECVCACCCILDGVCVLVVVVS